MDVLIIVWVCMVLVVVFDCGSVIGWWVFDWLGELVVDVLVLWLVGGLYGLYRVGVDVVLLEVFLG